MTIDWQVDGWRDGPLGRLYRPKYFQEQGIAIHGYTVSRRIRRRTGVCG
ncbi:hypothetical protein [Micromonospora sp. WMMB482]|nr:hypothetical protein [Micromonospora sp. WMMB482]